MPAFCHSNARTGLAWLMPTFSLVFWFWQNFVEVYELTGDHYEFENIATTADPSLLASLKDDLTKLESCSGTGCSGA